LTGKRFLNETRPLLESKALCGEDEFVALRPAEDRWSGTSRKQHKKTKHMKKQTHLLLYSGIVLLVAACATDKAELPPQAVTGLTELRTDLINNKAQIAKTAGAARDMLDHPRQDVTGQMTALRSALAKLSADTQQTRVTGAAAQSTATDYFATWDQKLKTLSGQMAEAGQQRRKESMDSWAKLQELASALRGQYNPFMADLQSADQYLKTDPTASGVKAASPTLRSALAREADIKNMIDALVKQIDVVRAGK
jgi:hypothetical protein